MEIVMRASALCVIGAVFALVLKKQSPELVPLLALAAVGAVIYMAARTAEEIRTFAGELAELAGMSPTVLAIVLKTVAIAVIAGSRPTSAGTRGRAPPPQGWSWPRRWGRCTSPCRCFAP
jgi:hypothetical protein